MTILIIRLTGTARQVFARLDLMADLAGEQLTLGDIARLTELLKERGR